MRIFHGALDAPVRVEHTRTERIIERVPALNLWHVAFAGFAGAFVGATPVLVSLWVNGLSKACP